MLFEFQILSKDIGAGPFTYDMSSAATWILFGAICKM